MNRGPWESYWQEGKSQNSGNSRSSLGGARPKNPNAGAQSTSSNSRSNQSKQNVRGRAKASSLVFVQSKRQMGSENVVQQNEAFNQKPKLLNPWKQVVPVDSEVLVDESLLQDNAKTKSHNKNQASPQNTGMGSRFREYPVLNFTILTKLADPTAEAFEIARKLTEKNALADFLESHKMNLDYLELVVIALGQFCEKNGPTLFYSSFIKIVSVLGAKGIFAKMPSVILELPRSRATNLGSKNERLNRIVKSIARLTTEMLTVMPAFSCDVLGKDFIEDVHAMVNVPSVRSLDTTNIFSILLDVKGRLQVVFLI